MEPPGHYNEKLGTKGQRVAPKPLADPAQRVAEPFLENRFGDIGDQNGTYLSPNSATNTVCSLDAAQRNPGIGVMTEQFSPHFAALHAGYV